MQKKPAAPETSGLDTADHSVESGRDHEISADQENPERPRELGGPVGPDPTRYGDWERKGRCIDF
ncbi:MAG: DUF1674 domain-containing protein [Gammaproteobacteria bacterium]|jgi:hypothetical protein|nr:DUF1674 domain-containing protein [Chromatiales bacterium]MDP6675349.1 DUF1674 domain-containing protein [Gammaproteobacteria bacterium]